MKKSKLYRYYGRNGIITTPIFLEDAKSILLYNLKASEGKILTDGELTVQSIVIYPEDLELWKEIDDPNWTKNNN